MTKPQITVDKIRPFDPILGYIIGNKGIKEETYISKLEVNKSTRWAREKERVEWFVPSFCFPSSSKETSNFFNDCVWFCEIIVSS